MALAASFLHRWPFGANQHMVFAAPLVFDPAPVEFYAGRDFLRSSVDAHSAARVWFISIRAGHKDYAITGKDVVDRLRARRPHLLAVEE